MKAEELDKKFDDNEEDVIQYFDMSTARRPNQEQRQVSINFPFWMLNSLDKEANRIGVTRESIIKFWLAERLEDVAAKKSLLQKVAE